MALIKALTFESGALTGADAFNSTDTVGGSHAASDANPIVGMRSYRLETDGLQVAQVDGRINITSAITYHLAFYLRIDSMPSASVSIVFWNGGNEVVLQSDGTLRLYRGYALAAIISSPLVTGTVYRVEVSNVSGGNWSLSLAEGDGASTLVGSLAAVNAASQMRVGNVSSATVSNVLTFDEIHIDDATVPVLPALPIAPNTKELTFESGTATGADAFDATIGSSAIDSAAPILETRSLRFTQAGAYGRVSFTASDAASFAFYLRVDATPTFGTFINIFAGGSSIESINIGSDLRLRDGAATNTHTPMEVGKTYRVEAQFKNNADGAARVYVGVAEGNGPIETAFDHVPSITGSQPTQVCIGFLTGYTLDEIYIRDDLTIPTLPALPEPIGLATPTGLAATTVDHASITIAWEAVAEAISYDLRWSLDDADWTESIGVTSPHVYTELTPETLYYYQVRAVNDDGVSDWSASSSATTDAAPEAPDVVPVAGKTLLGIGLAI